MAETVLTKILEVVDICNVISMMFYNRPDPDPPRVKPVIFYRGYDRGRIFPRR